MKYKAVLALVLAVVIVTLFAGVARNQDVQAMAASDKESDLCYFDYAQTRELMEPSPEGTCTNHGPHPLCPPGEVRVCCSWHYCAETYWGCCPWWLFPFSCGLCCSNWQSGYECNCYPENYVPTRDIELE